MVARLVRSFQVRLGGHEPNRDDDAAPLLPALPAARRGAVPEAPTQNCHARGLVRRFDPGHSRPLAGADPNDQELGGAVQGHALTVVRRYVDMHIACSAPPSGSYITATPIL